MADTRLVTSVLSPFRRRPSGTSHLLSKSAPLRSLALLSALCASAPAEAEQGVVSSAWRNPPHQGGSFHRRHGMRGKHGFAIPVFIVQREPRVIIEREVVREVPVVIEAPEPPPPPREPYVVGKTYASLPGGCMKLIEAGASYYLCSGEWYRQVGTQYRAVARP